MKAATRVACLLVKGLHQHLMLTTSCQTCPGFHAAFLFHLILSAAPSHFPKSPIISFSCSIPLAFSLLLVLRPNALTYHSRTFPHLPRARLLNLFFLWPSPSSLLSSSFLWDHPRTFGMPWAYITFPWLWYSVHVASSNWNILSFPLSCVHPPKVQVPLLEKISLT